MTGPEVGRHITWFVAILAGLYMLAVWLIEKDEATPRLLGLTIFLRWIPVYRGPDQPAGQSEGAVHEIPAEGRFPVILVACHGLLAVTTLILVLLTALDVAG
jgi:hypothetical protein